jgi:VanZ family protein
VGLALGTPLFLVPIFDNPEPRGYAKRLRYDEHRYPMSGQTQRETKPVLFSPAILATLCALLLGYGTLYPLSGWTVPDRSPWSLLLGASAHHTSRSDILLNILVYVPFGLLLAQSFLRRTSPWITLPLAVGLGGVLSMALELLQAYLPSRVPSIFDVVFNTSGAFIGALAPLVLSPETMHGRSLRTLRQEYIAPGRLPLLGLFTVLLWATSQLTPFVPSLDVGNLREGLKPLWYSLHGTLPLDTTRIVAYALNIAGLGLLATTVLRPNTQRLWLVVGFVATTLVSKVPVLNRQLSLEAATGALLGLLAVWLLEKRKFERAHVLAALCLIAGLIADALRPGGLDFPDVASLNWILFRHHFSSNLIGLMDIAASTWPFFGLSYLTLLSRHGPRLATCVGGAIGIFALVLTLEWLQQSIPGRSPDVTDAVLAVSAWTLPWLHPSFRATTRVQTEGDANRLSSRRVPGLSHSDG